MCTSQLLCVALSALWMPCLHKHQKQEWSGLHLWLKMSDPVWQTPARVDRLDQIACQTMIKSQSTTKRRWQVILPCELFQQKTQITLRAFVYQSIFKQSAGKKLVNIKWFHPSSPVVNAAILARELYSSSLCCSDETVWTPVKCSKVSPIRNVVVIQRQCSEFVISSKQYERPETTCCHFIPSVCTKTAIYSLGKRKPFNMVHKKGEMTFLGQFASI